MSRCAGRWPIRSPGGGFAGSRWTGSVPHPTTLMKLTTRCGSAAVDGLNEALLAKAAEAKLLRTNRIRADTTVVPANVCYPTDSGLLAKAMRRIAATGKRIQAAGGAVAHHAAGPLAGGRAAGARDRRQAAHPLGGRPRRGAGHRAPGHWPAGRAGRHRCRRGRAAAGQRQTGVAPGQGQGRRAARTRRARRGRGAAARAAGPRGQRPDRAAGGDAADRGADPAARRRASLRTGRPDGSACTTPMPARSPRAGSGARSSSGTRPRSSTTTTGSCWITLWSRAIRPTRRNWPRRGAGEEARRAHAAHRHRRPRLRRSQGRPPAHRPRCAPTW